MMVGRIIRENKDKAIRFLSNERYFWIYIFCSLLLTCGEILLISYSSSDVSDRGVRNMFIFTLPMFLPYFYWALRHPHFGEGSWLATIGRKYSAYIYIFHVLAATGLGHIVGRGDSLLTKAIYPFLVFGVSLIMSWLFVYFMQCLRKSRK